MTYEGKQKLANKITSKISIQMIFAVEKKFKTLGVTVNVKNIKFLFVII